MKTSVLIGGEYSYLIPSLLSKKYSGHVHSIFTNGFNIAMNDSLIFIGNKKSGKLPFGIHLQEDMSKVVTLVNNQEPVRWSEDSSSLELPNMTILLVEGEIYKNDLTPLKSNKDFEAGFDRLVSLITPIKRPTGLDVHIGDFLKRFDYIGQVPRPETEQYLIKLIQVAMTSDVYLIDKTLRFLLGRGQGLTPSGDDLLVGFLAFDSIAHFVSPCFYKQLSDLVNNETLTTDVSREYLKYALNHEFSSTVTDVVNILSGGRRASLQRAFDRLLKVGHSSGLDTIFGILIGMLAFKNPIEQ